MSTVAKENFQKLIFGLIGGEQTVMGKRKLISLSTEMDRKQKIQIKCVIKNVDFVTTIADIWSTPKRSFLGVTMHWLDESLQRHSVTLK